MAKKRSQGVLDTLKGFKELEQMMKEGKRPEELFTVRTVEIPEPGKWSGKAVRKLRGDLKVSQGVFAAMVGASDVLVQGWEQGIKSPSAMARRLLDLIATDPQIWLGSIRRTTSLSKSRKTA